MRKIEKELRDAINCQRPFSKGNTVFHPVAGREHEWELVLHGNSIALFRDDGDDPSYPIPDFVSLAGYTTKTTCSRLNALEGVRVHIKKGVPYLNGREIDPDGWWSPCNLHD